MTHSSRDGFALIEALIAIIVFGVGVLGIAKLNGVLLQGTGESKTRNEATQIAQRTIEEIRRKALADTNSACGTQNLSTSSHPGLNANYTITPSFIYSAGDKKSSITVLVSWEGAVNPVILKTFINCQTAGTPARIGSNTNSTTLKAPTGRAKVGTGQDASGTGTENKINGTEIADGTATYINSKTGLVELYDTKTKKVLLTYTKNSCETTEFSTISGKVFVQTKGETPIAKWEEIFIEPSDASYCAKLEYEKGETLKDGGKTAYKEIYYQCYVGPEWWGNVSILWQTNSNKLDDRVSVGNPLTTVSSQIFSSHSQRSIIRGYRGYSEIATGKYDSIGIGKKEATCDYEAKHFTDHHFVISSDIGSDADCIKAHALLNTYTPLNSIAKTNPGKFYCFSELCPEDLVDPYEKRETTINVKVDTKYVDVDKNGTDNSIICDNNGWGYACRFDWNGQTTRATAEIKFSKPTCSYSKDSQTPSDASVTITNSSGTVTFVLDSTVIDVVGILNCSL